jgi:predicted MPP superfamily phosphohydrolase
MFASFIIFISFVLFLCVAVVWFVCWVVARIVSRRMPFAPFAYSGVVMVLLFWATMWYGYRVGRFQLRVQQTTYTSGKVPAAFDGYKIVHISDLHLSSMADSPEFLLRVIDSINAQQPDVICFTGDFVGFGVEEARPFTNMLRQLQATDAVISVLGNHDFALYHHGLSSAQKEETVEHLAAYQRDTLGWKLLRNQSFVLTRDTSILQIIGVDNASCQGQGFQTVYRADLPKAMLLPDSLIASSPFKILLSHDPSHWRAEVLPNTDIPLTLSGHTHAGQMRILGYPLSSLMFTDSEGWCEEDGQSLYINTGIGCTLPVRVGVPAEITVITLKKSQ